MATWSLSSDFSLINNPSSVWSYGSKPPGHYVAGMFSLFTHLDSEPNSNGIVAWFGADTVWNSLWLGVYYNTRPTTNILNDAIMFPANGVAMHPGDDGRFSVVRFTAPTDGNYALDVTFTHIHICSQYIQYSAAYVIYNDFMTLWEIELAGPGDSKSFKSTDSGITVKSNEHIDFIVGVGTDNVYNCDMTLARVDIHLLENSIKDPVIAGLIGFVLGLIISSILFYGCYRYYKNRRNVYEVIG
jgi:hypothetical protein